MDIIHTWMPQLVFRFVKVPALADLVQDVADLGLRAHALHVQLVARQADLQRSKSRFELRRHRLPALLERLFVLGSLNLSLTCRRKVASKGWLGILVGSFLTTASCALFFGTTWIVDVSRAPATIIKERIVVSYFTSPLALIDGRIERTADRLNECRSRFCI